MKKQGLFPDRLPGNVSFKRLGERGGIIPVKPNYWCFYFVGRLAGAGSQHPRVLPARLMDAFHPSLKGIMRRGSAAMQGPRPWQVEVDHAAPFISQQLASHPRFEQGNLRQAWDYVTELVRMLDAEDCLTWRSL